MIALIAACVCYDCQSDRVRIYWDSADFELTSEQQQLLSGPWDDLLPTTAADLHKLPLHKACESLKPRQPQAIDALPQRYWGSAPAGAAAHGAGKRSRSRFATFA